MESEKRAENGTKEDANVLNAYLDTLQFRFTRFIVSRLNLT
jgi:hypothetical protein